MRKLTLLAIMLFAATNLQAAATTQLSTRPSTQPALLGVNIHFTKPQPGELKMMADAGVNVIRMDFAWAAIEREKGRYDFAEYDFLLAALDDYHIRAVFILDYGNPLYDDGLSPHSDAGRAAFAKWAAAAATHFKGRGVIWEMWNEPNGGFWKPRADVADYIKLAMETGKALRAAAPDEIYVGPATSEIDMPFLETCFKAGCLDYWSAVTVHPYRQSAPETVAKEYRALRFLIAKYAPKGKTLPIYSGEWGYSAAWKTSSEERQGEYLPRQWLTNIANDVPLSIWYDWHDDGTDPKEGEHHFGTVHHEQQKGDQPWEAKPAYLAMKTLHEQLDGFEFSKRLAVGEFDKDYVLLFAKKDANGTPIDTRLAVWTTRPDACELVIPASSGVFDRTFRLGEKRANVAALQDGIHLLVNDQVQYLAPVKPNELLILASAWTRLPLGYGNPMMGGFACFATGLKNPLKRKISCEVSTPTSRQRTQVDTMPGENSFALAAVTNIQLVPFCQPIPLTLRVSKYIPISQWVEVGPAEPSEIAILSSGVAYTDVLLRIGGKDSDEIDATVNVEAEDGRAGIANVHLVGAKLIVVRVPFEKTRIDLSLPPARMVLRVSNADDGGLLGMEPLKAYFPLAWNVGGNLLFKVVADGDRAVKSDQSLRPAEPPAGRLAESVESIELTYRFDPGHKFIQVMPTKDEFKKLPGKPKELRLWVYGDNSGNLVRARFVDAGGQTFQPTFGRLDWAGWRLVTFPLDGSDSGHWGGKDDGVVQYPVALDTLLLIDNPKTQQGTSGKIYFAAPMVME